MLLKKENRRIIALDSMERANPYEKGTGSNGKLYVKKESVCSDILHVSEGNSKTGPCWNFNLSVEYTCDHRCECYLEGLCYAEQGCYMFADNQAQYSENYNFYVNSKSSEFIAALQVVIDSNPSIKLFRYFTCGDIPDIRFVKCMVQLAKNNPDVKFWSYTKKYSIVNHYLDDNEPLPENLVIIFSHWQNRDKTFFPMDNPHNLPTSEFIPVGQEERKAAVTHVCPCSDPSVNATCKTCDHPCYTLKPGESMALLEHSTKETKQRDKEIKAAKKALKK